MCEATGGEVCPRVSVETEGTVRRGGGVKVCHKATEEKEREHFSSGKRLKC